MENQETETPPLEFDVGGDQRDELFDVLSNHRRRVLLYSLQAAELPISVDELTTELVAWEARQSVPGRSCDDRDAIEISLLHNHLPKMADADIVKYDDTERRVLFGNRTDELQAHLQTMSS